MGKKSRGSIICGIREKFVFSNSAKINNRLLATPIAVGNAIAVILFVRVATDVLSLRSLDDIFLGEGIYQYSALLSLGSSQVIQKYWTVLKKIVLPRNYGY